MRGTALTVILLLAAPSAVPAQQWAKDMFDHTSHDFGTVARGAEVKHSFPLQNIYVEDVHIAKVVSTCKCHKPKIVNPTLKTYEKGAIVVEIDTRRFTGRRDATLTVFFDKPFPAEVQLNTYCYIRSDVVVEPGAAHFGLLQRGTVAEKKLMVSYAGRSDWQILRVESARAYLEGEARQVSRSMGEVSYELTVRIKGDAPVGPIRDHLVLVTNDQSLKARRVPVLVEAEVVSGIAVSPSPLPLGIVRIGQTVTRNLVIQAKSPFRITQITGPDERFQFMVGNVARPLQLVPVTFAAGDQPGKVTGTIRIHTDLESHQVVEVEVDGQVVAPGSSGGTP
ncbi:MAG TPA: DUF1573 domain-containing protein [Planctomycetes bacterium]|nr:DUF1573 domain-containing protein [Planctomycetota bacterium]